MIIVYECNIKVRAKDNVALDLAISIVISRTISSYIIYRSLGSGTVAIRVIIGSIFDDNKSSYLRTKCKMLFHVAKPPGHMDPSNDVRSNLKMSSACSKNITEGSLID